MLEEWIKDQNQLIDWERDAEVGLLTDRISALSAKVCQSEGLSLLNLEVESSRTVLFGRCCVTLQRVDKGQILQCFKVGDEISLYNPKLKGNAKADAADNYTVMGLISKVAQNRVDIVVDEFDDHLLEPPLRMDLRSSQKTHITMKSALTLIKQEGAHHPLVNLLFRPEECSASLLVPARSAQPLSSTDLWNRNLNESQQLAIECALNTPAVAIIHGPPGTGKTSTLTELILQAVSRNIKVLVCAPSNIAVDTILGRLADFQQSNSAAKRKRGNQTEKNVAPAKPKCALSMVRIGHPARISAKIMKYALDSIISNDEATEIVKDVRKDIDNLRDEMSKKRVWKRNQPDDDNGGVSYSQMKRDQRADMRALQKEARQRERAVVVNVLRKAQIVLCTCVGAGSKILKDLDFDMVVIDEAAQGLEAACWVPIMKLNTQIGGKVVLAGDHCQLPPTIKSPQAEKGGLGVTLFERIIKDRRFHAVVRLLDTQYRMNWRISDWASVNMYHGAIKSHPSVAHHTLKDIIHPAHATAVSSTAMPSAVVAGTESDSDDDSCHSMSADGSPIEGINGSGESLEKTEEAAAEEESQYPVLLLVDTSGLGMLEDSAGSSSNGGSGAASGSGASKSASHRNFHEAELVKQHVLSLVRAGVKPSQIGVITPYNGQLEVLRELMFPTSEVPQPAEPDVKNNNNGKLGKSSTDAVKSKAKVINPLTAKNNTSGAQAAEEVVNLEGLEIKTIDGFQGGEKECILLSLVRSNTSHTVGFLGEKRRINVAVTRAKRHLAVFCDSDTCSVDRFMCTLLDHMSTHGDHISAQEFLDYSTAPGGYFANCSHVIGDASGEGDEAVSKAKKSTTASNVTKTLAAAQTTLQRSDFLAALEKLKSGHLAPADAYKNAVCNIRIPELVAATNDNDASQIADVSRPKMDETDAVSARFHCATGVLRFPPSMNSYCRMLVHECAEALQLFHRSSGEGHQRCIEVSCSEFPPEGSEPLPAVPKKQQAPASKPKPTKTVVTTVTPPVAPPVPVSAQDAGSSVGTNIAAGDDSDLPATGSGPSLSTALDHKSVHTAAKKAPLPPHPSAPKQPQVYMGAGRQSALGRLEKQHEDEMKNKSGALDEDALIEAAIQHNQRLAHLHQYRVPSRAMPNPEKVHSKEKLHSKVAEAALARARGGDAKNDSSGSKANNNGTVNTGGTSTGYLGNNMHGFTHNTNGSSSTGSEGTKDKSTGSNSSKKKVLKKPPPNFGGGTLGGK